MSRLTVPALALAVLTTAGAIAPAEDPKKETLGTIERLDPDPAIVDDARSVLRATAEATNTGVADILYARVDGEGRGVDRVSPFHHFALVIHHDEVRHANLSEVDAEGIDPEAIGP